MNLTEFIEDLEAKGVDLWVEEDRLRYRGAKDLLTPEVLDRLKANKHEVLALQRQREEGSKMGPLSHGQSALWFLHQLAPDSPAYNVGFAARVHSRVDVPALRRALDALAARHASLRTAFPERNGAPVREIHKRLPPAFEASTAAGLSREELISQVSESYKRPFALETGPLLRAHLFSSADEDHVLSITVHHLVCDAWSLWLLLEELGTLYLIESKPGSAGPLPALSADYSDFVRWQREWLASPPGQDLWNFWKDRLAGEWPLLSLPTDRPRPPVQTFNGATVKFQISPQTSAQLKAFASAEGTTVYTVLLAAFEVFLHRYSGQQDIVLGSPASGRTQRQFADVIGDFINTVVLRSSSAGDPGFRAFLAKTSEKALDAIAHQDFPFSLLVDQLHAKRDPARSPFFQVLFNFQKPQRFQDVIELWVAGETGNRVGWGGLSLSAIPLPQQEGQFDLTLEMVEGKASLFGVLKYNTDLFDEATAARMAGHFENLLQGAVTNPDAPLSTLPLLGEAERHQLLVEWNRTAADYPRDKCVHELFEAQVARTPQAVAVDCEGKSLTYAQLNAEAGALAARLQALGVGPETIVGLCAERSLGMLVGLLGILKAGGAYLPLDPDHPQSRLDFILQDAGIELLCTQKPVLSKLNFKGQAVDKPSVKQDELCLLRLAGEQTKPSAAKVTADNLAYVIYTSGSTGQPKGVQLGHRGVVNFLTSMAIQPGLTGRDTLLALTTLSFDIAVLELLLPLTVGARVVIGRRETAIDPEELAGLIRESKATVIQATPATWRLLVDSDWKGSSGLKLLVGGEALPSDLAGELLRRCGSLWNMYGPTETTIWSAVSKVVSAESISLGRPIANTELLVLHPGGQLAPIGVPGELYIGGDGLARGYLKRPDLTAKAFIAHPFKSEKGARLYKTGDLVRYRADGSLSFLGRVDQQVKLRGYRIELGEIETAIRAYSGAEDAVVVVEEDGPGDKRLVAYVIPSAKGTVLDGALRRHLAASLPEYMVPSVFVSMDKWPLTGSGKIDRKAFPKPGRSKPAIPVPAADAPTPTQKELAAIWCDLLRIENPGMDDNLFQVGGHSLTAVRLVTKIQQRLSVKIPVASVFQHPTLRELSAIIDARATVPIASPPAAPQASAPEPLKSEPAAIKTKHRSGLHGKLNVGDESIIKGAWNRILQLVARAAPTVARAPLHRWRGVRVGEDVLIGYDTIIETSYPWLVSIGSHSAIGMRVVMIGHFLGTGNASPSQGRFSIEIGEHVWVGPGSLILPNVSIGYGSVVAAGSVVSSSVPPGVLVQGNPARVVAKCPIPVRKGKSFQEFVKQLEPVDADFVTPDGGAVYPRKPSG